MLMMFDALEMSSSIWKKKTSTQQSIPIVENVQQREEKWRKSFHTFLFLAPSRLEQSQLVNNAKNSTVRKFVLLADKARAEEWVSWEEGKFTMIFIWKTTSTNFSINNSSPLGTESEREAKGTLKSRKKEEWPRNKQQKKCVYKSL